MRCQEFGNLFLHIDTLPKRDLGAFKLPSECTKWCRKGWNHKGGVMGMGQAQHKDPTNLICRVVF